MYRYGFSIDVEDEEDALFLSPLQLPESLLLGAFTLSAPELLFLCNPE